MRQRRDDQPGSEREKEGEAVAFDANVTGKAAEAELGKQRPGEASNNENDAKRDQQARHDEVIQRRTVLIITLVRGQRTEDSGQLVTRRLCGARVD